MRVGHPFNGYALLHILVLMMWIFLSFICVGPPFDGCPLFHELWNVHYQDARIAVQNCGYTETVYADEFNAFKGFEHHASDGEIMNDMKACQAELHT